MNRQATNLVERLQALSPEQIAEVEDFAEFVRLRGQERQLTRSAAAASASAFETIWNNPEDDIYDAL
jgi:hypothetical protein